MTGQALVSSFNVFDRQGQFHTQGIQNLVQDAQAGIGFATFNLGQRIDADSGEFGQLALRHFEAFPPFLYLLSDSIKRAVEKMSTKQIVQGKAILKNAGVRIIL